jgi:2TM domain
MMHRPVGAIMTSGEIRLTIRSVIGMATTATDDREDVVGTTPEALREQALTRLKKRRDFKAHAFVYVIVNAVVWGIWMVIGVSSHSWWPWPVFITLGWGIGLVMNAWDVYVRKPITEDELQREIKHLQAYDRAREREG